MNGQVRALARPGDRSRCVRSTQLSQSIHTHISCRGKKSPVEDLPLNRRRSTAVWSGAMKRQQSPKRGQQPRKAAVDKINKPRSEAENLAPITSRDPSAPSFNSLLKLLPWCSSAIGDFERSSMPQTRKAQRGKPHYNSMDVMRTICANCSSTCASRFSRYRRTAALSSNLTM